MTTETCDVLIVGGGPIGLLTAVQLRRFGHSVIVIERDDKPSLPIYGRACTIWCRSMELLDALDLLEPLFDEGCITRHGLNYRDGKQVPGGMPFVQDMHLHEHTRLGCGLHIRQRLIEQTFESALLGLGVSPQYLHVLDSYTVNESQIHGVTATIKDTHHNTTYRVRSRYIVGADGAHSVVRKQANIAFPGDRSGAEWIRIDASVETDMPNPRMMASVQSATHGLVLWCPIDHGKIRIGYVFSAALRDRYGDELTEEIVTTEAQNAVAPFKLTFTKLDWYTRYSIGQRMAETFFKNRVALVGDACHTHSSGSAQGLNTGVFDATNLAWKMSLVLKGKVDERMLEDYNYERQNGVQQVINNDRVIATLISGKLPPMFEGSTEDPRDLLDRYFKDRSVISFTVGLGLTQPPDGLCIHRYDQTTSRSRTSPGQRAPEAFVSRLASNEQLALQRLMPNKARFYVLIFTGQPQTTRQQLKQLRRQYDHLKLDQTLMETVTVVGNDGDSALDAMLGVESFGRTYYDASLEAHAVYEVDPNAGAIFIVRPDGYIGANIGLDDSTNITEYFGRMLEARSTTNGTLTATILGVVNGHHVGQQA